MIPAPSRRLTLSALALLLAGCPGEPVTPPKPVATSGAVRTVSPSPTPTPTPARSVSPSPSPSPSATPRPSLSGQVALSVVAEASIKQGAEGAAITVTTLEGEAVSVEGKALKATADASGAFTIPGPLPSHPYVVHAALKDGHKLSAIALPEVTDLTLDEGSSMVVAMARTQLRGVPPESGPEAGRKTLKDLQFESLRTLLTDTRALLAAADFPASGTPKAIAPLQDGATQPLRNLYVAKFGGQVTTGSSSGPNRISDAWKTLLGYRPLGVTRVAGGGTITGFEGAAAREGTLVTPISAAQDAEGSLYLAERDGHRIRIVPGVGLGPRLAVSQSMAAGNLYTLAGAEGGPTTLEGYNALYQAAEQAAATSPASAPRLYDAATKKAYPLFSPYRLLLDKATSGVHLYFTSHQGNRVMLIPGADFSLYGRVFQAGRLYTIAGKGDVAPAGSAAERGDGGPAVFARLYRPTAIARDNTGNLYVLDAGITGTTHHGVIRLVRASDGGIVNVPLLRNGQPFTVQGAQDLRVVQAGTERFLYVADTLRHFIFRVALPTNLTAPAAAEIQAVLGVSEQAGTIDTAKGALPDALGQGEGIPKEAIKLNGPTSLEFDAQGNMLVADAGNGRILAVEKAAITGAGKVHVIGAAFKTDALEGDARLAAFPQSGYLVRDAAGNMLLPDGKENILRRIGTARGTF